MRRVLVNGESGVEVIFLDTLKKIGLLDSMIQRNVNPLVGFDGRLSYPVESIILLFTTVEKLLHVEFIIVDTMSAYNVTLGRYNVILGRGKIYQMKGVAYTFH